MLLRAFSAGVGLAWLILALPPVITAAHAQMTPEQRKAAVAAYTGPQIVRQSIFTNNMDRTMAFWGEGLGYSLWQGLHPSLGGPKVEKAFGLMPGGKIELVVLDPGGIGGVHLGLFDLHGEPLKPFKHPRNGPPQAGESFLTLTVPDQNATITKLRAMGFTIRSKGLAGKSEAWVVDPDGNIVLVSQLPAATTPVLLPVTTNMTAEQRKDADDVYTGTQISQYGVFTPDMDQSIKFWTEGLGFVQRPGPPQLLGGSDIEKGFRLKPGSRIRLVTLEPGDTGGPSVGLVSLVGQSLKTVKRDPKGTPQAGETFAQVRVHDELAMVDKLKAMGFPLRTGSQAMIISPEGNVVLIAQDPLVK